MKNYPAGTVAYHKKRKVFGNLTTGIGMKSLLRNNDITYECMQELSNGLSYKTPAYWYSSNLIILNEDTPQNRLAIELKYG